MSKKLPIMTQARMWKDYLSYVSTLQKGETFHVGVEIFLVIFSLYIIQRDVLFPEGEINHSINIIVALIIFQFLWDMNNARREINSYFNIQHSILRNPADIIHLLPSKKEREVGFVTVDLKTNKDDRVFVSEEINRYLQTSPITISLTHKKKEKIHKYLEEHKEVLLQYLNYYFFDSVKRHREFTNGKKFCMSADISLHNKTISCHTSGYYDSFLTNQIIGTTLVLKDKKNTTLSTEHIFPSHTDEDNNQYLDDLTSSPMNNHVGASTLGFTQDHKFIIWQQGENNQFNTGLLVPTGSGSANATDIRDNNLQKTVICSMERELQEESSDKKKLGNYQTIILGFYRWVSRGGKPEFVGLTKIPRKAEQLISNAEVADKKEFVCETIDDIPTVIEQIKKHKNISIPLFMCVRQLEYMYKNYKKELENFLFV